MVMQKSLKNEVTRSVIREDCRNGLVEKGIFSSNLLSSPLKGKGKVVPVLH
jgi:hypothetical protein